MKKFIIFLITIGMAVILVISFKTSNEREVITDMGSTQDIQQYNNDADAININRIDTETGQSLPGAIMVRREMTIPEKINYYFTTPNGRSYLITHCMTYGFILFLILYTGFIFIHVRTSKQEEKNKSL